MPQIFLFILFSIPKVQRDTLSRYHQKKAAINPQTI